MHAGAALRVIRGILGFELLRDPGHLAAGRFREALDDYDRAVNRRPDLVARAEAIRTT